MQELQQSPDQLSDTSENSVQRNDSLQDNQDQEVEVKNNSENPSHDCESDNVSSKSAGSNDEASVNKDTDSNENASEVGNDSDVDDGEDDSEDERDNQDGGDSEDESDDSENDQNNDGAHTDADEDSDDGDVNEEGGDENEEDNGENEEGGDENEEGGDENKEDDGENEEGGDENEEDNVENEEDDGENEEDGDMKEEDGDVNEAGKNDESKDDTSDDDDDVDLKESQGGGVKNKLIAPELQEDSEQSENDELRELAKIQSAKVGESVADSNPVTIKDTVVMDTPNARAISPVNEVTRNDSDQEEGDDTDLTKQVPHLVNKVLSESLLPEKYANIGEYISFLKKTQATCLYWLDSCIQEGKKGDVVDHYLRLLSEGRPQLVDTDAKWSPLPDSIVGVLRSSGDLEAVVLVGLAYSGHNMMFYRLRDWLASDDKNSLNPSTKGRSFCFDLSEHEKHALREKFGEAINFNRD
jgi:hypothetical protein